MTEFIHLDITTGDAEVCLAVLNPGDVHVRTIAVLSDSESLTASYWKLQGTEIKDVYALSNSHTGADVRISEDNDMVEILTGAAEGKECHIGGFVEIERA